MDDQNAVVDIVEGVEGVFGGRFREVQRRVVLPTPAIDGTPGTQRDRDGIVVELLQELAQALRWNRRGRTMTRQLQETGLDGAGDTDAQDPEMPSVDGEGLLVRILRTVIECLSGWPFYDEVGTRDICRDGEDGMIGLGSEIVPDGVVGRWRKSLAQGGRLMVGDRAPCVILEDNAEEDGVSRVRLQAREDFGDLLLRGGFRETPAQGLGDFLGGVPVEADLATLQSCVELAAACGGAQRVGVEPEGLRKFVRGRREDRSKADGGQRNLVQRKIKGMLKGVIG